MSPTRSCAKNSGAGGSAMCNEASIAQRRARNEFRRIGILKTSLPRRTPGPTLLDNTAMEKWVPACAGTPGIGFICLALADNLRKPHGSFQIRRSGAAPRSPLDQRAGVAMRPLVRLGAGDRRDELVEIPRALRFRRRFDLVEVHVVHQAAICLDMPVADQKI